MEARKAIVMDEKDNVATLLADVDKSEKVRVETGGGSTEIEIRERICLGHKFATREIGKGENIVKYGEPIGRAIQPIGRGQHVHVHNVESLRVRGDLSRGVDSISSSRDQGEAE
ncbi:MAG: UxaA family hydrolase [Deltaproteobacteria bacterium]|nr:UxaA family hydrolase [Deltaproteobacteria bacterium]MBW2120323.1 UxaA family hydrolase [Deltaproteobacteria bacterium]